MVTHEANFMAKEALIHKPESNWSLIQLGLLSHNLNIHQQQYLEHCILMECLYNHTLKNNKGFLKYLDNKTIAVYSF